MCNICDYICTVQYSIYAQRKIMVLLAQHTFTLKKAWFSCRVNYGKVQAQNRNTSREAVCWGAAVSKTSGLGLIFTCLMFLNKHQHQQTIDPVGNHLQTVSNACCMFPLVPTIAHLITSMPCAAHLLNAEAFRRSYGHWSADDSSTCFLPQPLVLGLFFWAFDVNSNALLQTCLFY